MHGYLIRVYSFKSQKIVTKEVVMIVIIQQKQLKTDFFLEIFVFSLNRTKNLYFNSIKLLKFFTYNVTFNIYNSFRNSKVYLLKLLQLILLLYLFNF